MDTNLRGLFIQLVRVGIGHTDSTVIPQLSAEDWVEVKGMADAQGLLAIVLDGMDALRCNDNLKPETLNLKPASRQVADSMPKRARLEWIGKVLQQEQMNAVQLKAAAEMALMLHEKGIRTYVLKGQVVAECYPRPEHRGSVDLDCFLIEEAGFKFQDSSSKEAPGTWHLKLYGSGETG